MNYVAGFLFTSDLKNVLLVCKTRPDWQVGLWNGVGGKIEDGELAADAMAREGTEETGIAISLIEPWKLFCKEVGPGYEVSFFKSRLLITTSLAVRNVNDVGEQLAWLPSKIHAARVVGNLHWLIPMALDWRELDNVTIRTPSDIKEHPTW